jgi:Na+/glutamate symporter
MTEQAVITVGLGFIGLLGTIVSSWFTYLMAKQKQQIDKTHSAIKDAARKREEIAENTNQKIEENTIISKQAYIEADQLNQWRIDQDRKLNDLSGKLESLLKQLGG